MSEMVKKNLSKFRRHADLTLTPGEVRRIISVVDSIKKGFETLSRAAARFSADIERRPELMDAYKAAYPDVPERGWELLDMVGRKRIDPRLIYADYLSVNTYAKLPLKKQKELLDKGVEVRTKNGVETVPMLKLTHDQVRQAFNGGRVIPAEQQKILVHGFTRRDATVSKSRSVDPRISIKLNGITVDFGDDDIVRISRKDVKELMNF